eukprot:Seg255.4 transcript_id=Seg255.4/GoldUCD/mRNA.D3Y31 product="putative serine incorporator" protein_id=Seg255.4/GoldUCD/D3Y31
MGAVLNTAGAAEIAAELACCACSSVCGFISKDQATRAKLRYITLLLFATIMCFVTLVPGMRRNVDRIPKLCGKLVTSETCDKFFGFSAVYRIMLSMTSFYGILAVFTLRITRADSLRAKLNNGFWIIKGILLIGIMISTFLIPRKSEFFRIWMYVCLIGGFIFMLYQIMLVIDFGHSWSVAWAERLETSNTKLWYLAMVLATLLMFMISLAAVACFYFFFAGSHALTKCKANLFYMTFIVIQCFLATVISVTPTVQQELAGAGLLQSSVVVLYTMYLTFNTLSTEPDEVCNPLGKVILDYDKMSGINGEALFGCLLTFALVIFACTVRAHTSHLGKYGMALSESEEYALSQFIGQQSKQKAIQDKEQSETSLDNFVGYNYSLFHIIMMLASLHLLMILTDWHSPEQKSYMRRLVKNWASVWVQMASSFICILMYIWFLVTPLVRKIWGPLFGIPIMDDSSKGQGFKGQSIKGHDTKFNGAKDSEEKVVLLKSRNQNSSFKDVSKLVSEKDTSRERLEKEDFKKNLKRFKSVESLKSAVSSITKRKNRHKQDGESSTSQILEQSQDRSRETIFSESENKHKFDKEKRRTGLQRFGSIESLKSGISAISKATNNVKRKLKTRLNLKERQAKTRETRRQGAAESVVMDQGPYNGNESTASRIDQSREHIARPNSKLERLRRQSISDKSIDQHEELETRSRRGSPALKQEQKLNEVPISHNSREPSGVAKSRNLQTLHFEDDNMQGHQDNIRAQTNTDNNSSRERLKVADICDTRTAACDTRTVPKQDNTNSNASDYSASVFKQKAQDPAVARDILRIQWKILRLQAKVVKIQEKIMRIQAEDEAAKENAHTAVERMEPPLGHSSIVAGGVYSKRHDIITNQIRKELG